MAEMCKFSSRRVERRAVSGSTATGADRRERLLDGTGGRAASGRPSACTSAGIGDRSGLHQIGHASRRAAALSLLQAIHQASKSLCVAPPRVGRLHDRFGDRGPFRLQGGVGRQLQEERRSEASLEPRQFAAAEGNAAETAVKYSLANCGRSIVSALGCPEPLLGRCRLDLQDGQHEGIRLRRWSLLLGLL